MPGRDAALYRRMVARPLDLILPVGIITSVLVIMVPLPPVLMDIMLSTNITLSVIMLLTTIYVSKPLEFSIFPSLLLASTLGRLVLNVATTRLILTNSDRDGMSAAGDVVRTFSEFVAGDKIVVGLIIFVIIVVIQFVVITKGATRISEVAARFALDGMPGRQMAIDADLQARIIDENEAKQRREELARQADFYGSMDGASKFVRGDAIAGIIITLVNIVGGLIVGVIENGMTVGEAASLFTRLTIGDGLVSQVPAFLVSVAAGLLVTRSSESTNLPSEFLSQLFMRPQALLVAGGFLCVLIFTSLPTLPLVTLGGSCIGLALLLTRRRQEEEDREAQAQQQAETESKAKKEERIEDCLIVDPMEMEIGVGLIRLADPARGGDLLERIQGVKKKVASDMGLLMPRVRIRDNQRIEQNAYVIKVAGSAVAEGTVHPKLMLALESGMTTSRIEGIEGRDPVYDMPAVWIDPANRDRAAMAGYTVVEPTSVLATHLTRVVSEHADEILTRDATKHLVDELKATSPAVVEELIPKMMSLAEVQQVLQMLLREQVSIRQLGAILEALGDHAGRPDKDPVRLTELVRNRLARSICTRYSDEHHRLKVVTLAPEMEDRVAASLDAGLNIRMSPQAIEATCEAIRREVQKLEQEQRPAVVLVNPAIRAGLKRITQRHLPRLAVLSYNEITRDTVVESVGVASEARPAAAGAASGTRPGS